MEYGLNQWLTRSAENLTWLINWYIACESSLKLPINPSLKRKLHWNSPSFQYSVYIFLPLTLVSSKLSFGLFYAVQASVQDLSSFIIKSHNILIDHIPTMNPASLVKEKLMFFIKKLCRSHSEKHGVVPKGYIPVYVEGKRYKIPLKYLSRPACQKLLNKSQTDLFDPKIEGPLVLRCTTDDFHKSQENFNEY